MRVQIPVGYSVHFKVEDRLKTDGHGPDVFDGPDWYDDRCLVPSGGYSCQWYWGSTPIPAPEAGCIPMDYDLIGSLLEAKP